MGLFSTLTRLTGWAQAAPPPHPATVQAFQRITAMLGPALGDPAVRHKRLQRPLQHALDYCGELALQVPGVLDIAHRSFAADPLVHALFASADDIDTMLARSLQLREHLDATRFSDAEHVHALLAMRRHEKAVLGMEIMGDTVRTDVPQTLLYFADHTLAAVAEEPEQTRDNLRLTAFDSLITSFANHLDAIRQEKQQVNDDRAMARSHLAVMRNRASGAEMAVHTRRIEELDERLRHIADSLQPTPVLDALADFLATPELSLRLEPVEVCVDRNGVIRNGPEAANGHADALGFPELVTRDRRRHVVMLARFRRDDAREALAKLQEQQARFVVI